MAKVMIAAAQAAGFFSLQGRIEKAGSYSLSLPEGAVNIGGNGQGYLLASQQNWNPLDQANRDDSFVSFSLGDDCYVYAVQGDDGYAKWLASKNATYPNGYDENNSRKLGGFHYGRIRPASQRYNANFVCQIEIVGNSAWDLAHRPSCDPTGMVEIVPGRLWCDIYLSSAGPGAWPDISSQSRLGLPAITGVSGYSYFDYSRIASNSGKRLPAYTEWLVAAYGVPQGAAGSRADTGDMSGYGFDCVSCVNVDQPSGNIFQVCSDMYNADGTYAYHDDLDKGADAEYSHGQYYGSGWRQFVAGGHWNYSSQAGSRFVTLHYSPWAVLTSGGFRCVCDSL
ncbi:hypothetical protein BFW38_06495 [Terasakiispira papahanaumokuakeensis]|uniref:Major tropism determinant second domain-containing protein n=1 Tax=Terasakiispira papahanaumokuakeensis TaxID=197479 RepID=A0A1E2V8F0_9GAMM|nr:hypothetical protein [Terasakiispira papahanaumokuakeensis]ODC03244.1 hypothetical protein BFW38_06495 [Terasakiispira papahanaumokuakeensis]